MKTMVIDFLLVVVVILCLALFFIRLLLPSYPHKQGTNQLITGPTTCTTGTGQYDALKINVTEKIASPGVVVYEYKNTVAG